MAEGLLPRAGARTTRSGIRRPSGYRRVLRHLEGAAVERLLRQRWPAGGQLDPLPGQAFGPERRQLLRLEGPGQPGGGDPQQDSGPRGSRSPVPAISFCALSSSSPPSLPAVVAVIPTPLRLTLRAPCSERSDSSRERKSPYAAAAPATGLRPHPAPLAARSPPFTARRRRDREARAAERYGQNPGRRPAVLRRAVRDRTAPCPTRQASRRKTAPRLGLAGAPCWRCGPCRRCCSGSRTASLSSPATSL